MFERSHKRAKRYRQLALAEHDQARATLLQRLADEAERGVLCIAPHVLAVHAVPIDKRDLVPPFQIWPP
jgi:hypothetical protein